MLTLITNRNIVKKDYYRVIEEAVKGGIDAIILREKDLPPNQLLPMAERIKTIIGDENVKLIINSNLEVARAVKADGIQVSYGAFMKEKPTFEGLVGVSVHSLEEAVLAEKQGASYLLASHVFETSCKAGLEPKGLGFIKNIKSSVAIPVMALGGITLENIQRVIDLGVEGVALMSGIMATENPFEVTRAYKEKMK